MPKKKTPVISFSPALFAAVLKGSIEEVKIPMKYNKGIVFRRRVYQLRERMREEAHPKYEMAARCQVKLLWGLKAGLPAPEKPDLKNSRGIPRPASTDIDAVIVLSPHDSDFDEAIKKAGVDTSLHSEPLKSETDDSPINNFLNEKD